MRIEDRLDEIGDDLAECEKSLAEIAKLFYRPASEVFSNHDMNSIAHHVGFVTGKLSLISERVRDVSEAIARKQP